MEKLKYVIEDRTIAEILGVQNFTNVESAILELVKNAYDAQAKEVYIIISRDELTLFDDGIGMNRDTIVSSWMHIGTSSKEYKIGIGKNSRVLAGSKGVGRFAIARLGSEAHVFSKMNSNKGVGWHTDWNTSSLVEDQSLKKSGTKIVVKQLRDVWTDNRVAKLKDFLSRTYHDDKMKIFVEYKNVRTEVKRYFQNYQLGVNCVSVIKLNYDASKQTLQCIVESDEFKDEVQKICPKINLKLYKEKLNMVHELDYLKELISDDSESDLKGLLSLVGDFSSEFYFSLKSSLATDAEKYYYKYQLLEDRYSSGVVLYRNAFSISSYEGKKDWLSFGKRSRLSPAAASHQSGSWRVRENQIAGKVIIDKIKNPELKDLMNRQGLEENDAFQVFLAIIISGIKCFERYRQSIIRLIAEQNETLPQPELKVVDKLIKNPEHLEQMSPFEKEVLLSELSQMKKEQQNTEERIQQNEAKYQYDIRLLNILATSGLKATSIAHEMHNDRNQIESNVTFIIDALKKFGCWERLNEEDCKSYAFSNVPKLLESNQRVNQKMMTFMDVMLKETEKEQFRKEEISLYSLFREIKSDWERDYAWIEIVYQMDSSLTIRSAKDIFRVIFDNLILNSIQQNDKKNQLQIVISVQSDENGVQIQYKDSGVGLIPKYQNDPKRILEVHETSRPRGHGIGMWMVNNTILSSGGKILRIDGTNGFEIQFIVGSQV